MTEEEFQAEEQEKKLKAEVIKKELEVAKFFRTHLERQQFIEELTKRLSEEQGSELRDKLQRLIEKESSQEGPLEEVPWLSNPNEQNSTSSDIREQYEYLFRIMEETCTDDIYVPLSDLPDNMTQDNPQIVKAVRFMQGFDRGSMKAQGKHKRQLRNICASALAFLILFELFAHFPFPPESSFREHGCFWLLIVGILCLVASAAYLRGVSFFGFPRQGATRMTQLAYIDARCVAEFCRVLVFWRLNGMKDKVHDLIPIPYRKRRLWIVDKIVEAIENEISDDHGVADSDAIALTRKHWELDQIKFFHEAHQKQHLIGQTWADVSSKLFISGLICVIGLIALSIDHQEMHGPLFASILTVAPMLIVCSAIAEFYLERLGSEPNTRRYEYAEEIFTHGFPGVQTLKERHDKGHPHGKPQSWLWYLANLLFAAGVFIAVNGANVDRLSFYLLTAAGVIFAIHFVDAFARLKRLLARCKAEKAHLEGWTADRMRHEDPNEWEDHVRKIGKEAIGELIDWYISASDRVISIPKG